MDGTTTFGSKLPSGSTHIATMMDLLLNGMRVTPVDLRRAASASGLTRVLCHSVVDAACVGALDGRSSTTFGLARRGAAAAHARLGQHKFDACCRLVITCNLGGDGSHLLVTRQHQEGRRASVGFHTGEV